MKINSIPEKTWTALQGSAKADPNYPQGKSALAATVYGGLPDSPQQGNERSLLLQKFSFPKTSSKFFVISTIPMQISWTPGYCVQSFLRSAISQHRAGQPGLCGMPSSLCCKARSSLSSAPSRGECWQIKLFPGE